MKNDDKKYISFKTFIEMYIPKRTLKNRKNTNLCSDKSIKQGREIVDDVRRKFNI